MIIWIQLRFLLIFHFFCALKPCLYQILWRPLLCYWSFWKRQLSLFLLYWPWYIQLHLTLIRTHPRLQTNIFNSDNFVISGLSYFYLWFSIFIHNFLYAFFTFVIVIHLLHFQIHTVLLFWQESFVQFAQIPWELYGPHYLGALQARRLVWWVLAPGPLSRISRCLIIFVDWRCWSDITEIWVGKKLGCVQALFRINGKALFYHDFQIRAEMLWYWLIFALGNSLLQQFDIFSLKRWFQHRNFINYAS